MQLFEQKMIANVSISYFLKFCYRSLCVKYSMPTIYVPVIFLSLCNIGKRKLEGLEDAARYLEVTMQDLQLLVNIENCLSLFVSFA